ncbi:MAG: hypothetical protein V4508_02240 [Pseudomonadota bacterium]
MSLDTYANLQLEVADWLHRGNLGTKPQTFIMLAEKRISMLLRARLQETAGTIATVAGVATAALPSTLLGIESLSINGVVPSIDYLSPEQFKQEFPDTGYSGAPRAYTTIGDTIYFGPVPDAVYSVAATYRASVTPLSDAAPTNSLLTKWPNVYLFGALVEGSDYAKDVAAKANWEAKFQDAIAGVNLIDWHAGGLMRVRTDVRS